MALYYNLPVYKSSYKLLTMIFVYSNKFAREYKYTIGQNLKDEGSMLVKNIYRANKAVDKMAAIEEARENVEMIRLFTRLMQEFNQLSLKQFVEINRGIEDVSTQLAGWEKYCATRNAPPESSTAREQTSARSKSNNPLAKSEESRPMLGQVARTYQKDRATNRAVIFPLAGNRNNSSGGLNNQGSNGNYWSSSVTGTNAYNLNFNSTSVNPANNNNRANGLTVRCLKDLQKI